MQILVSTLQNPEVMEQFFDGTGQIIREGYGQTESVCKSE
jgi:acyl-coenzyme A synthetase/AMP-(fatty) acid ligase